MSVLRQLADQVEALAENTSGNTPTSQAIDALIDELVRGGGGGAGGGFAKSLATQIVLSIDISVTSFDRYDVEWLRIIKGYSKLIWILHAKYGLEGVLSLAPKMSLEYTEG